MSTIIPVSQVEFHEGQSTLWVHSPDGATVLRIKTLNGSIVTSKCQSNPVSHADLEVMGDIHICLADDAVPDVDYAPQLLEQLAIKLCRAAQCFRSICGDAVTGVEDEMFEEYTEAMVALCHAIETFDATRRNRAGAEMISPKVMADPLSALAEISQIVASVQTPDEQSLALDRIREIAQSYPTPPTEAAVEVAVVAETQPVAPATTQPADWPQPALVENLVNQGLPSLEIPESDMPVDQPTEPTALPPEEPAVVPTDAIPEPVVPVAETTS